MSIKKTETSNEITKSEWGEHAGEGFENVNFDSLAMPFIILLQPTSPVVSREEIEGAKAGMFYSPISRELLGNRIIFQPVFHEHLWIEWMPRESDGSGGGFVGTHSPISDIVLEAIRLNQKNFGKLETEKGTDLVETHHVYGNILDDAAKKIIDFGVIPFTSTKITPLRNWLTSMYKLSGRPPIYANRAIISSIRQTKGNNTFYNYDIKPLKDSWMNSLLDPSDALVSYGKELQDSIKSGKTRVDYSSEHKDEGVVDVPF